MMIIKLFKPKTSQTHGSEQECFLLNPDTRLGLATRSCDQFQQAPHLAIKLHPHRPPNQRHIEQNMNNLNISLTPLSLGHCIPNLTWHD